MSKAGQGENGLKEKNGMLISQCMIVKNEEKNIERALSWGKGVVWEQIVVDTGSEDRTVELARKMGAKVFFLEWPEDFAAAKNYAIDQAKGEWIVFLDADEYMSERDAEMIPKVVEQLTERYYDGITVMLHNLNEEGQIFSSCSHLRLFRNTPNIRYQRRIHEQLVSLSGRELRIVDGTRELSVYHTGYQEEVSAEKKKNGRNRRMLEKELEEHPEDPELLGYMGDECFDVGDQDEAERWYRSAIEHMPPELKEYDQRSAVTFARLLMLLTERKDAVWSDADAVYRQAVKAFPKEGDLDYIAGRFFASHGHLVESICCLESALSKLEQYGYVNRALLLSGNLGDAYDLLTKSCYEAGDLQKCVTYAVAHLKYERYEMKPLLWLLKSLFQGGEKIQNREQDDAVMGFLSKIYDVTSLKDRLFVLKTAQKAGCDSFADYMIRNHFTENEREQLEYVKRERSL